MATSKFGIEIENKQNILLKQLILKLLGNTVSKKK